MRKRRMSKVKFDSGLIIDSIGANLIVQKAPAIIQGFIPVPDSIKSLAGVGAGYLAGMLLKRPNLANISIGLGVVDFIAPMVDSLIGGSETVVQVPAGSSGTTMIPIKTGGAMPVPADLEGVADYVRLNAYVSNPGVKMDYSAYKNSY